MTNPGRPARHSTVAPASDDEEDIDDLNDDEEEEEEDDDSIMEEDDDDTVVGTCLHCSAPPPPRSASRGNSFAGGGSRLALPCSAGSMVAAATSAAICPPAVATRVQVSCDDCRSFICDACHWCHEFQANHEIRVCDRCDAFYCRGCDEMDQCEDCSEVVCNTCSTLMSCKFCGCGLCEDCATACGRCGIVLCARDAKFAVECDTCRMSYCLVCLASGTKDPCVRCGHRPSKRVEQLVHLRLKSIYKAFKQSGASVGPGSGNGNVGSMCSGSGGSCRGGGDGRDGPAMGGKYSSALRSLTENGSDSASGSDKFTGNFDQSMASEVAAVLQTASNSMVNADGDDSRRSRGKRTSITHPDHSPSPSSTRNRSSSRVSNAAAERYFRKTQAEMEAAAAAAEAEAEAAAAALLAELDEEEVTTKTTSKKSKKKKKKKEKKLAAEQQQQQSSAKSSSADSVASAAADQKYGTVSQKKSGAKNKNHQKSSNKEPPPEDDSSDEEMNFEQLVGRAKGGNGPSKREKKEENIEAEKLAPPPKPKPEPSPSIEAATTAPATTADFDAELAILLSNEDEEGLETFLANLKGVPGLGAARKTAKKALKKIKEAHKPVIPAPEPERPKRQGNNSSSVAPGVDMEKRGAKPSSKSKSSRTASTPAAAATATAALNVPPSTANQHEPLLRVVSRTQSNVGATSNRGGASSNSSNNNNSTSVPASARAECVMHMSPAVVGWVIGKGGSRIRDMMEESGAKIWIDQESMGAKESRVVYVSGKRSSVDTAVRMVKDLVAKAPVAASAAASQGVAPALAPSAGAKFAAASAPVPSPTAHNSHPPEAAKEPTSFAAAIGASAAQPAPAVTVTPPGPNPATPTKQPVPAQQPAATEVAPHPIAAPQSVPPPPQPVAANAPALNPMEAGRGANLFEAEMLSAELTCDPRFVALLIGRRGWTVKNIQAESGADLRIDQSREPPRIIISGKAEDVRRAERMVRDVLKYPHAQLQNQEVSQHQQQQKQLQQHELQQQQQLNADLGMMDLSYSNRSEHSHVADSRRQHPSPLTTPTDLHRNVLSSSHVSTPTPSLLDELRIQQESSRQTNYSSGYSQYQQHQQPNQNHFGLFQDSSLVSRIPDFLPNDRHPLSSTNADPNLHAQPHESWGHHNRQAPSIQNQYSALPPFSGGQLNSREQQFTDRQVNNREQSYMLSNIPNAQNHAHQSPPRDDTRTPSSTFVLPPEHHLHFSQNLETSAVHQAPMPPAAQVPSTRVNDFINTGGDLRNSMNGWDLPASTTMIGGSWNQQSTHQNASVGRSSTPLQQPGFQAQAVSNNPFQQQRAQNHCVAPTALHPTNNDQCVSDDSLMVDNMFAALGTSSRDGDGGLFSALNSVSLGGAITKQGSNLASKIDGWGAEDSSSSSSFLKHSRLGDYREGDR